jgi:hypothetical protein
VTDPKAPKYRQVEKIFEEQPLDQFFRKHKGKLPKNLPKEVRKKLLQDAKFFSELGITTDDPAKAPKTASNGIERHLSMRYAELYQQCQRFEKLATNQAYEAGFKDGTFDIGNGQWGSPVESWIHFIHHHEKHKTVEEWMHDLKSYKQGYMDAAFTSEKKHEINKDFWKLPGGEGIPEHSKKHRVDLDVTPETSFEGLASRYYDTITKLATKNIRPDVLKALLRKREMGAMFVEEGDPIVLPSGERVVISPEEAREAARISTELDFDDPDDPMAARDEDDGTELTDEQIEQREEGFKRAPEFKEWKVKHHDLPKPEQEWLNAQPKEVQDLFHSRHFTRDKLMLAINDAMREDKRFKGVGDFLKERFNKSVVAPTWGGRDLSRTEQNAVARVQKATNLPFEPAITFVMGFGPDKVLAMSFEEIRMHSHGF